MKSVGRHVLVEYYGCDSEILGDASLLENWIREGDEQGNVPVNAFVFLSIVFGFIIFVEQSYE